MEHKYEEPKKYTTHYDCSSLEELHNKLMNTSDKYAETKDKIGDNYKNIISHMDLVWHHENGPDGCSKCTKYQEILFKAFREIHELSGRDLSKDLNIQLGMSVNAIIRRIYNAKS